MEQILHKINFCASICYIVNIAISQSKGTKMTIKNLATPIGNINISEINEYFIHLFGESFTPFSNKDDIILIGTDMVRNYDTEIIDAIRLLNKDDLEILKSKICCFNERVTEQLTNSEMIRESAIKTLEDSNKNNDLISSKHAISDLKHLSRQVSFLRFLKERYNHYLAYIGGLTSVKDRKALVKKHS